MALKTYRPTTPGLRQLVLVDRGHLWKGAPVKMLTEGKTKSGGRNNHGRITTRHIGGGHKQAYRRVDFRRTKHDMPAKVERLEYDPNRTAFIALLKYQDGTLVLHPGAAAPRRRRQRGRRRQGRREARQRHAAGLHADRHHRAQHRAQGRRRRQDRALGRRLCAARRPRRRLGHPAPQLGRDAARARGVHGDRRRGLQPRSHERVDRQGRPHALAAARARPCARSP